MNEPTNFTSVAIPIIEDEDNNNYVIAQEWKENYQKYFLYIIPLTILTLSIYGLIQYDLSVNIALYLCSLFGVFFAVSIYFMIFYCCFTYVEEVELMTEI